MKIRTIASTHITLKKYSKYFSLFIFFLSSTSFTFGQAFITTWQTTSSNESITIPTEGDGYDFTIDWGDGTQPEVYFGLDPDPWHVYSEPGTYSVSISGDFPRIYFNNGGDKHKIMTIEQWGNIQWESMNSAFEGCSNLICNSTDSPDLSSVTDLSSMFREAELFNQDLNHWNVSNVTNFSKMFMLANSFNGDVSNWNVSNATDMDNMFYGIDVFEGNLSSWDVSNVTDMNQMFMSANAFNGDISSWDVSSVTDMHAMFNYAVAFNGDLSNWNVSNVTDMHDMFYNATSFDGDISQWDVSSVETMANMFNGTKISSLNYDKLLNSWSKLPLQHNVDFHAGNSVYSLIATVARRSLIENGWAITDGGEGPSMDYFITTWQTTSPNESITIPTIGGGYDFAIHWGYGLNGGYVENYAGNDPDPTHVFVNPGTYTIMITGDFPRIFFYNSPDKDKILTIEQWGGIQWLSMEWAFNGCSNLISNTVDAPDLTQVNNTSLMFKDAISFTGNLNNWDVSSVTNMNFMFFNASSFDGNLSNWNVSSLITMNSMFREASSFSGNLSNWDVSTVVDMGSAFFNASSFNSDVSNWNVSSVISMRDLFRGASSFNSDIGNWNVSSVTNMNSIFRGASSFTGNLSNWDVSAVTDMGSMFQSSPFNGDLNSWDVSSVTNMNSMFWNSSSFNGNISNWDVSSVTDMRSMFQSSSFDGDISDWNVSSVTNMNSMFWGASFFNGDLSSWDVSAVMDMGEMFRLANSFDGDISNWNVSNVTDFDLFIEFGKLSSGNYDELLNAWSQLPLQEGLTFHAGNSRYTINGQAARELLIGEPNNWIVTDGGLTENPAFEANPNIYLQENIVMVRDFDANDGNGGLPDVGITYSISGGVDQAVFIIDGATGELNFQSSPDYENPLDMDADNCYDVEITADDGVNITTLSITVVVTDENDNSPVITSANTADILENTTAVITVTTTDADVGGMIIYSISGGTDQAVFVIDGVTGELRFQDSPDYENPLDVGARNSYEVEITAHDGVNTATQSIAISIIDENESPVIISANTVAFAENGIGMVLKVNATDEDEGSMITYGVSGGLDQSVFIIDGVTGELSFQASPDYENPLDTDVDNRYVVEVTANDGVNNSTQIITINVTNENDNSPVIVSANTADIPENTTAVITVTATDADEGSTITYSISGGADQAVFTINGATGELNFQSSPDYETPLDANVDNLYEVEVSVNDGVNTTTQLITVNVSDENDNSPIIVSSNTHVFAENDTGIVLNVNATDEDAGSMITYGVSGGLDQSVFIIDGVTGELSFQASPDYENPLDTDIDNSYVVEVTANDGVNNSTQLITVNVTDENDNSPVIVSVNTADIPENTTAVITVTATDADEGSTITYSVSGGADQAVFTINGATGELNFQSSPDYETPLDADVDNTYELEVTADDGVNTTTQSISIAVTDENDNSPVVTSANTANVPENETIVLTVSATDIDTSSELEFTLSGGVDQSSFTIDNSSGALAFIASPNYEQPSDQDEDNSYEIEVSVSDGVNTTNLSIVVTVTNQNDTPTIYSSSTPSVEENVSFVITVAGNDEDEDNLTYGLSGGVDQSSFTIDIDLGTLSFIAVPDYEVPLDADADNSYEVEVVVSDGVNASTQLITVNVTNENDNSPVVVSSNMVDFGENDTGIVLDVNATDEDEGSIIAYGISGGDDQSIFVIDEVTGELSFRSAPDYEKPVDVDVDNIYEVDVMADDGSNSSIQSITINVTNENDNSPVIISPGLVEIAENTSDVISIQATDAEENTILIYGIDAGTDFGKFAVNSENGKISFQPKPDFENPTDNNLDNIYEIIVSASDGVNTSTQPLSVKVTDENDNKPVFVNGSAVEIHENTTVILTVETTDVDTNSIVEYGITGGADEDEFSIVAATGELYFLVGTDFENPIDSNMDNVYEVAVTANDGENISSQIIQITVTDENDTAPIFGNPQVIGISENTTYVLNLETTDPDTDGSTIIYGLYGGADEFSFIIDENTGALMFENAPDFENPSDDNRDNTYQVEVSASDGVNASTLALSITVTDENDNSPVITNNNEKQVSENSVQVLTLMAEDADAGSSIAYTISGGNDQSVFSVDAVTGNLWFITAPDFENPADSNLDNIYELEITASDGKNSNHQLLTVSVTDVNDNSPVFVTSSTVEVIENNSQVFTVEATDADKSNTIAYRITGGDDQDLFTVIELTGLVLFKNASDYENPSDSDRDNVYQIEMSATDGLNIVSQVITITVVDENDNSPEFTTSASINVIENNTEILTVEATDADTNDNITYSITGGEDKSVFSIDQATGGLSFQIAPDFENPTDTDTDNSYEVQVTASDQVNATDQLITVTVLDEDDDVRTGLDPVEKAGIRVYPNPVKNELIIESENTAEIMIYDLMGQLKVHTFSNYTVDTSRLPSGLYIITINAGGQFVQTKIKKVP